MPIINGIAAAVCRKRNIPFMLTATDLNTTSYINSLHFPENDFHLFKYAIAFPDFSIFSYFAKANFNPRQIEITGFPVRPEFLASRDRSPEGIALGRQLLQCPLVNAGQEKIEDGIYIPEGRKVIALSMGAQGSVLVYRYLDILVEMQEDFHVIVLCGNNKFRVEVERRYASSILGMNQANAVKKVTITPLGHSVRVSDIMAASDLFIGKPGGNTTLETVYSGIPVLLDGTNGLMDNERGNARFIEDYELGALVEQIEDLPGLINRYLIEDEEARHARSTLRQQQLAVLQNRKFNHDFPLLVEEMLHIKQQLG
jgi:UDP-N-acetylglucosamine:LPS N-acetylglucosamine transferase